MQPWIVIICNVCNAPKMKMNVPEKSQVYRVLVHIKLMYIAIMYKNALGVICVSNNARCLLPVKSGRHYYKYI